MVKTDDSEKLHEIASDLAAAASGIVRRLRSERAEEDALRARLSTVQERSANLEAALSNLLKSMNSEERAEFEASHQFIRVGGSKDEAAKGNPIDAIIEIVRAADQTAVRAEEVQARLEERGFDLSPRYAANTLARLMERGDLVRVGRGRYRLSTYGVGIEALHACDFD